MYNPATDKNLGHDRESELKKNGNAEKARLAELEKWCVMNSTSAGAIEIKRLGSRRKVEKRVN